jgi:hypothetical protein
LLENAVIVVIMLQRTLLDRPLPGNSGETL